MRFLKLFRNISLSIEKSKILKAKKTMTVQLGAQIEGYGKPTFLIYIK